jgi:hypothetical protein
MREHVYICIFRELTENWK